MSQTTTVTHPAIHPEDRVFAAIDTPDAARAAARRIAEELAGAAEPGP